MAAEVEEEEKLERRIKEATELIQEILEFEPLRGKLSTLSVGETDENIQKEQKYRESIDVLLLSKEQIERIKRIEDELFLFTEETKTKIIFEAVFRAFELID